MPGRLCKRPLLWGRLGDLSNHVYPVEQRYINACGNVLLRSVTSFSLLRKSDPQVIQ